VFYAEGFENIRLDNIIMNKGKTNDKQTEYS